MFENMRIWLIRNVYIPILLNKRAAANISGIIILAIAGFVGAAVLPAAITMVVEANTTGWSTESVTLWGIVPIFMVLGFAVGLIAGALKALGKL